MEGFLSKIVSPKRVNLMSLIYTQREALGHFEQKRFTFVSFDNLKIHCVLFQHKAQDQKSGSLFENNGLIKGLQKMINKDSFNEKELQRRIAEKMQKTLLIYNHSHGSSKFEGSHLLTVCAEQNMSLVLYDLRACGESEGDIISFGKNEKIDLLYLLLKLQVDFGYSQFLLWGRSIGCNAIINFLYEMEMNKSDYLNEIIKKKKQQEEQMWRTSGRAAPQNKRRIIVEYPKEMFNRYFNKVAQSFGTNNGAPDWKDRIFDIVIIGKAFCRRRASAPVLGPGRRTYLGIAGFFGFRYRESSFSQVRLLFWSAFAAPRPHTLLAASFHSAICRVSGAFRARPAKRRHGAGLALPLAQVADQRQRRAFPEEQFPGDSVEGTGEGDFLELPAEVQNQVRPEREPEQALAAGDRLLVLLRHFGPRRNDSLPQI